MEFLDNPNQTQTMKPPTPAPAMNPDDRIKLSIPLRALKAAAVAISKDETRYTLNGYHLQSAGNHLFLVTTDGRRMIVINITDESEWDMVSAVDVTFQLPQIRARALIGGKLPIEIIPGPKTFIEYKVDFETVIRKPVIEGNYPIWAQVINVSQLNEQPGICVNPTFCADMIKAVGIWNPGASVNIFFTDAISPIYFTDNHRNFLGILMPMRDPSRDSAEPITWKEPSWLKAALGTTKKSVAAPATATATATAAA